MSASQCPACRQEFTGVTAFDAHQDVDYTRRPPVLCLEPRDLGMARDRNGRFYVPGTEADRARLNALRARRVA
jgi:hypothetical protein